MWHLDNIPKRMFVFWGTQHMPWVRYLTLQTFRVFHPQWEIVLYKKPVLDEYPPDSQIGHSYWDRLDELEVVVKDIDVEAELGTKLPCTYITVLADIMRYIVLNKEGGLYCDTDLLFFRSLEDMVWNKPENKDVKVFMLPPPYHHIILGQPGGTFYNKVLEVQKVHLPLTSEHALNTTGCTQKVKRTKEDGVLLLPLSTTEENFCSAGPKDEYALALDWHGSGTFGKYQKVLEDTYMTSDHPLAAVIRYCLSNGDIGNPNGINDVLWITRGE